MWQWRSCSEGVVSGTDSALVDFPTCQIRPQQATSALLVHYGRGVDGGGVHLIPVLGLEICLTRTSLLLSVLSFSFQWLPLLLFWRFIQRIWVFFLKLSCILYPGNSKRTFSFVHGTFIRNVFLESSSVATVYLFPWVGQFDVIQQKMYFGRILSAVSIRFVTSRFLFLFVSSVT